ncbi:hypothetical protein FNX48_011950 [Streptomyces sp. IF17]|nr:hypothetical protein [Streptomyces alkaliphilus]
MAKGTSDLPEVGTVAVDTKQNRVGVIMGRTGSYVQLRPEEGGLEWDVKPEDLRLLTAAERLWPKVREANSRSTKFRL